MRVKRAFCQYFSTVREGVGIFPYFMPGIFFLLVGILALLAPRLILALLAGAFVFIGIFMIGLTWKIISFKKKLDQLVGNITQKVHVHTFTVNTANTYADNAEDELFPFEDSSTKKIIIH